VFCFEVLLYPPSDWDHLWRFWLVQITPLRTDYEVWPPVLMIAISSPLKTFLIYPALLFCGTEGNLFRAAV